MARIWPQKVYIAMDMFLKKKYLHHSVVTPSQEESALGPFTETMEDSLIDAVNNRLELDTQVDEPSRLLMAIYIGCDTVVLPRQDGAFRTAVPSFERKDLHGIRAERNFYGWNGSTLLGCGFSARGKQVEPSTPHHTTGGGFKSLFLPYHGSVTHVEAYTPVPGAHGPSSGLSHADYEKVFQAAMALMSEPNDNRYQLLKDILCRLKAHHAGVWRSHHLGSVPARLEVGVRLCFGCSGSLQDAVVAAAAETWGRLISTPITQYVRTCKTGTWVDYNIEVYTQLVDFFLWRMHPRLVQPSTQDIEEYCALLRLPEIHRNSSWMSSFRRTFSDYHMRMMNDFGVLSCRKLLVSMLTVDFSNRPAETLEWYRRTLLLPNPNSFSPAYLLERTLPTIFSCDHEAVGVLQTSRMEVLYNLFGVLAPIEWLARSSVPIGARLQAVGNVNAPSELHIRAVAFVRRKETLERCQTDASQFARLFGPSVMRSWSIGGQEDGDHGVLGALYGSNFFDLTSSISGTDLWMARMSTQINLAFQSDINGAFFPSATMDLTRLCSSLARWSSSFMNARINRRNPIMGFTEVLAGRIAKAYRTVFGPSYEGQMASDLYAMFHAHNFVPRTGAWYPLPTRNFLWGRRKLELVHVTSEGPTPAAYAFDDEQVNELYRQAGMWTAGERTYEHQRRKFTAKWGLLIHHCLKTVHRRREGFALEIHAFRTPE